MKKLNHPIPYNGGVMSIQASEYHYCIPKTEQGPYSAVEIAVFDRLGKRTTEDFFKDYADDSTVSDPVYAYVPITQLVLALKKDGYSDINVAGILERLEKC